MFAQPLTIKFIYFSSQLLFLSSKKLYIARTMAFI